MTKQRPLDDHPLGRLGVEDLNMVQEFVLRSGSVKDLAAHFGVSYPTMRARLDQLIQRIKDAAKGRKADPMADCLADLVNQGTITLHITKKIREVHREIVKEEGK